MKKRVFLVRHAESQNNVDKRETRRFFGGDVSWKRFKNVLSLAKVDMDSSLTERGRAMAQLQHDRLAAAEFVQGQGIQLCLHSPLQRAKHTADIIFGDSPNLRMVEHPLLYEKCLSEYLYSDIQARVESVKRHLLSLSEETIVLVAHAGFFNVFAGEVLYIKNCEVIECSLHEDCAVDNLVRVWSGGSALLPHERKD